MKRVLIIAYFFPPLGGSGLQRTVKFIRYLPLAGYESVVVTGPSRSRGFELVDASFEHELPPKLDVHRVSTPEPPVSSGWRSRSERWLRRRPPVAKWWTDGVVDVAHQVSNVDLIYATMSPWESGEAAARLARKLRKPWVADLRDPWALDEVMLYPTRLHRSLERRRMQSVLSSAAAIIMNTPEAASQLRSSMPRLARIPVTAIPNGFDAADFVDLIPPPDPARFRVVHTGHSFTGEVRAYRKAWLIRRLLGGMLAPVDFLTRSHVFLLRAVELLRNEEPELSDVLEVHLAGVVPADDQETLGGIVRYYGYVPHAQAVSLMRSADLLFLPLHDLPPGTRARIVPGKTYEYLGSGRPVLGALPDGDARDLLSVLPCTYLTRPSDVEGIAAVLRERLASFRRGEPTPTRDPASVETFERRFLTRRLAHVFDDVLASEREQVADGHTE